MSDDLLEWPEAIFDVEDVDDIEVEYYVKPKKTKTSRARRKLEMYWERKRLAENLYDVFTDSEPSASVRLHDSNLVKTSAIYKQQSMATASPRSHLQ